MTVAGFLLTLSMAACAATPGGRLYVRIGPPAAVVEARTSAPGPGYVWIAGFHRWNGASYVWVPGRWERPPRARARWAPGHWVHGRQGWYFVEGRWR
jgi:hypothetical protein